MKPEGSNYERMQARRQKGIDWTDDKGLEKIMYEATYENTRTGIDKKTSPYPNFTPSQMAITVAKELGMKTADVKEVLNEFYFNFAKALMSKKSVSIPGIMDISPTPIASRPYYSNPACIKRGIPLQALWCAASLTLKIQKSKIFNHLLKKVPITDVDRAAYKFLKGKELREEEPNSPMNGHKFKTDKENNDELKFIRRYIIRKKREFKKDTGHRTNMHQHSEFMAEAVIAYKKQKKDEK